LPTKAPANPYTTESLPLAAALKAKGLQLSSWHLRTPTRAVFEFEDRKSAEKHAANYVNNKLPVDAQTYMDAFNDLRTLARGNG
jgi:hypothetical protein